MSVSIGCPILLYVAKICRLEFKNDCHNNYISIVLVHTSFHNADCTEPQVKCEENLCSMDPMVYVEALVDMRRYEDESAHSFSARCFDVLLKIPDDLKPQEVVCINLFI